MAGIYLHIPFCKKKCFYCDFYVSLATRHKPLFIEALIGELKYRKNFLKDEIVNTIYFGGGTPSVLSAEEIIQILDIIYSEYKITEKPEITLEANPDDLSQEYLNSIKNTDINRLSIGIQSFFDDDLKLMNRSHTSQEAYNCIENAQKAGFNNITGDLIYGLPKMDAKKWSRNLETFSKLGIPHLSAYHLTYEEGTTFHRFRKDGKIKEIKEEKSEEQFKMLRKFATTSGYEHYEISNFAKEGFHSRHNSGYWKGEKYLGVGPSAHSYNKTQRIKNTSRLKEYIDCSPEDISYEVENLSKKDMYNEYLITSLRTKWGISTKKINDQFGIEYTEKFYKNIRKYLDSEHIRRECDKFTMTEKGLFISDKITEDLFLV